MAKSDDDSVFDLPADFLALGALLLKQGRGEKAVELARRAFAERPGDKRIAAVAHAILARGLPPYHRAMLAEFRFAEGEEVPRHGEQRVELVSQGGRVSGVMQWLRISFAPDIAYENAPGSGATKHWWPVFVPFAHSRETEAGDRVAVGALFNAGEFVMWDAN